MKISEISSTTAAPFLPQLTQTCIKKVEPVDSESELSQCRYTNTGKKKGYLVLCRIKILKFTVIFRSFPLYILVEKKLKP